MPLFRIFVFCLSNDSISHKPRTLFFYVQNETDVRDLLFLLSQLYLTRPVLNQYK